MPLYPNEMVPLQIDLAIGTGRYRFARWPQGCTSRRAWTRALARPVSVMKTHATAPPLQREGSAAERDVDGMVVTKC